MSFSWRRLKQEIKTISSDYDNVFLMVSGGVDSMFMLDFVGRLIPSAQVIHFKHNIRDNDHLEQELVYNVARDMDLVVHTGYGINLKDIPNQEHVARTQRWDYVQSLIAAKSGKSLVMTAHHYDDNIEHYFMSSMRGSDVSKLVMKKLLQSGDFTKYKPLLDVEKSLIIESAVSRGLTWIDDVTNFQDIHERNQLRNVIIPHMMHIRNIKKSMRKLIGELSSQ